MLTVISNGMSVNNETVSNDISVYSLFLISVGIFLIHLAASKVSFSEYSFYVLVAS